MNVKQLGGRAPVDLLGVNHHYVRNGFRLWDPIADRPEPVVVQRAIRAGIQSLRFPGGTVANLYDWKGAVVSPRTCQVSGDRVAEGGRLPIETGLDFGPDEYMTFTRAIGAEPLIMVPFVRETPKDAADWVEYMNTRAGDGVNPNGGVDWAELRAKNGHPKPYQVRRWEIGNEQQNAGSRFWLSERGGVAVKQYAFGGTRFFENQPLGKGCDLSPGGVPSDATGGQVFQILYPSVRASSVSVLVEGTEWEPVADLSTAGPDDRVFVLDATEGTVTFGDGEHGAVPPQGAIVRASYLSVHRGFFDFARAMHAVDPSIKVCSSWGTSSWLAATEGRKYDCLTRHALITFGNQPGHADWDTRLEGHDSFMISGDRKTAEISTFLREVQRRVPVWLTEFAAIQGDPEDYPFYSSSASQAAYMATQWAGWLRMGIPVGTGGGFLWKGERGVLGQAPEYTFSAEAVTREAISPMFTSGGWLRPTTVRGNPLRNASGIAGSYPALVSVSVKTREGPLYVMVVNRLPGEAVRATVRLPGFRPDGPVSVSTVDSRGYWNYNSADNTPVRLETTRRRVRSDSFQHVFPSTSTTVLKIPGRLLGGRG